ncbi:hypothetical protein AVEN_142317-1, partial [Araneus ventricosus]
CVRGSHPVLTTQRRRRELLRDRLRRGGKRRRRGKTTRSKDRIPKGQSVNKELCLEIPKQLRDAIRRKRPEKWATNDWFLLHDNVKKYLDKHSVTTLEHPPYSPDLAPADFYLFPRLKMKLKGHRFVDSDEVIENAIKQLKVLSKNGFQECFEQLYERWKNCVDAGGKYFEGQ